MVLADAAAEQEILLQHHADAGAQMAEIELAQVVAVDAHGTRLDRVHAADEAGQRRLAGAAAADDAEDRAGADRDCQVIQRRCRVLAVAEADILEVDAALDGGAQPGARGRLRLAVEDLAQHLHRERRLLVFVHGGARGPGASVLHPLPRPARRLRRLRHHRRAGRRAAHAGHRDAVGHPWSDQVAVRNKTDANLRTIPGQPMAVKRRTSPAATCSPTTSNGERSTRPTTS